MQKKISLKLTPQQAADHHSIIQHIAKITGSKEAGISGFHRIKKSIDARGRTVWINLSVLAFINEPFYQRASPEFSFPDVSSASKSVVIIGAGPAGLFAAIRLIELGIKPIVLERGKDVKERRRDLALINRQGIVNPESNYCFGEGGAGTYSDGKLYTRSSKRGSVDRILNLFVHFGASEKILYEAHPHIGTNKLPQIITSIRNRILESGGEFHFNQKVEDFIIGNDVIKGLRTAGQQIFHAQSFILATGHSARDIFTLLARKNLAIIAKPFALGVRIEHPQEIINSIQYSTRNLAGKSALEEELVPPASYSLVKQVEGRGVFSFCMCPGGIIAPAATNHGEIVTNGWSPSKRNNPYANSGLVVQVETEDAWKYMQSNGKNDVSADMHSPLLMMYFQQHVEQAAFMAGGGNLVAPAQRMVDFAENKYSSALPACSYIPGINSASLGEVMPSFITHHLRAAIKSFGKKMPPRLGNSGYYTNEAVMVATESRTSSPVKIPRNDKLVHPQLKNLYPCGEGAGYAGGIVSAAMDGERVASAIAGL